MNPHRPSWLKSHLRFYGRYWLTAGLALGATVFVGFLVWAIIESLEFYAPSTVSKQTRVVVRPPRSVRRKIDVVGPVSLRIQTGSLRHGDSVTIIRDLTAVLEQRLHELGLTVHPKSNQTVVVKYSEEEGQSVIFTRPGQNERIGSAKDTIIWMRIDYTSPSIASHSIARKSIQSGQYRLEIVGQKTISGVRRSIYQQNYARLLAHLKQVDLTILSPLQAK